ncbi:MAG TPA: hypothetical protein VMV54_08910, partial [Acidocella sp.]|nr:hypothetical protein [Acidocella sp.]
MAAWLPAKSRHSACSRLAASPFLSKTTTGVFAMQRGEQNTTPRFWTSKVWQFQLAIAMVRLVGQSRPGEMEPLEQYMCYWVGFNNICVTIANEQGRRPVLLTSGGRPQLERIGDFSMPKVRLPDEGEQLNAVYRALSPQLTEKLILHRSTRFFVNRLPRFEGEELTVDARGQPLNGVLNIGRTVDAANPVWCPIDQASYYAYLGGERTSERRDKLGKEILAVLLTVGKNRFHGG